MYVNSPPRGSLASQHLDLLRGLAALFVLFGHARNLFLVDYHELHEPTVSVKAFYFATGFGHECVVAFFVLSGLFIGSGVVRRVDSGRWRLADFLIDRGSRLYLVLLPALVLTCVWDSIGLRLTAPDSIYHGIGPQSVIHDVEQRLNVPTFVGNAVFAQTILVTTFGSNGPLWSLSNEFWYYLLFPCVWIALWSRSTIASRIAYATGFLAMAWFARSLLPLFPLWLMGAGVSVIPPCRRFGERHVRNLATLASACACAAVLVAIRFDRFPIQIAGDYALGVSVSLLIYCLLHHTSPARTTPAWRASDGLAAMSFTLYVVHMPMLMFVSGVVRQGQRMPPSIRSIWLYFGVCLLSVGYAWIISRGTEARTDEFRNLIRKILLQRTNPTDRATGDAFPANSDATNNCTTVVIPTSTRPWGNTDDNVHAQS